MKHFEKIIEGLSVDGFTICTHFLSREESMELETEAQLLRAAGKFKAAGIGQSTRHDSNARVRLDIRTDETLWFDPAALEPAQSKLWQTLAELMSEINKSLYLGLWDLEGHFAHYGPGAFYKKHVDRFRTDDLRTVSCILYFNHDWQSGDGGELEIHLPNQTTTQLIEPRGGTLVCFLSDQIEHEVLLSHKDRLSFAGWFRRRNP